MCTFWLCLLIYISFPTTKQSVTIWEAPMQTKNWGSTGWTNNNQIEHASEENSGNDEPYCPNTVDCWILFKDGSNGVMYKFSTTTQYNNVSVAFSLHMKGSGKCLFYYNFDDSGNSGWQQFFVTTQTDLIITTMQLPTTTWDNSNVGIKIASTLSGYAEGCYVSHVSLLGTPPTQTPTTNTPTTVTPTTSVPTTYTPTTYTPTTAIPTTSVPTTSVPTTSVPTTSVPTTVIPTTVIPTTSMPTTFMPSTVQPTTYSPTSAMPTTSMPTTSMPTTSIPTTSVPTTMEPTVSPTITIKDGVVQDTKVTESADEFDSEKESSDTFFMSIWMFVAGGLVILIICLILFIIIMKLKRNKSNIYKDNEYNPQHMSTEMATNIQLSNTNSQLNVTDEFARIKSVSNDMIVDSPTINDEFIVTGDDMMTPTFPQDKYINNVMNGQSDEIVIGGDDIDVMTPNGGGEIIGNDDDDEHTEGDNDDDDDMDMIPAVNDMTVTVGNEDEDDDSDMLEAINNVAETMGNQNVDDDDIMNAFTIE